MLIHTKCPIDGTDDLDEELYPASFDLEHVTPEVFSARRMPDRMHYRMVRNKRTGCVRADPILDLETILALYQQSRVNQQDVAPYTLKTYEKYLERVLPLLPDKRGALEIGCATGLFLEQLFTRGFSVVKGIELSADAVEKAPMQVRPHILQQPLTPGLFTPESFSLVCGFQVLDHLIQPNEILTASWEILAPGGIMYWICHDIGSPVARLLGERCPIIDIEHVVLYDKRTLAKLFSRNNFDVLHVFGVSNAYPLSYWLHLAPVPKKEWFLPFLNATGLGRWQMNANLGNMCIIARKNVQIAATKVATNGTAEEQMSK